MTDILRPNGLLSMDVDDSEPEVENEQRPPPLFSNGLLSNPDQLLPEDNTGEAGGVGGGGSMMGNGLLGDGPDVESAVMHGNGLLGDGPGQEGIGMSSNGLLGDGPADMSQEESMPAAISVARPISNGLLNDFDIDIDPAPIPEPLTSRPTLNYISASTPSRLPSFEAITNDGRSIKFGRRERRSNARSTGVSGSGGNANLMAPRPNSSGSSAIHQLLDTPIHLLMKEIQEDASLLAARDLQDRIDAESFARSNNASNSKDKDTTRNVMWVDKYRPRKFTELLGEERTNRDVLGWLKEWDKCVFKRTYAGKKKVWENGSGSGFGSGGGGQASSSTPGNSSGSSSNSFNPTGLGVGQDQSYAYHDQLGRPKDRVLLLSGPPGMGKTTLAHVVAKSAGYSVLEINASDDRTASTVSSRIQNAIDAGSGLHAKGKPTCVIIDEIDGAVGAGDGGFVRTLITLIQDRPASKKGKTPAKVLRRPIICICNDLYAPALRTLRPFARIIRFKKAQPLTMVNRMREICEREGLRADTRSLTALVEVTNNDVRSCLNTLQFIKAKSGEVNEKAIRTSSVGMKDAGASVHSVWNSLMVPVSAKKKRSNGRVDDGRYVSKLAFDVQACGEYDRLVQGCFEHYPVLKPLDPMFKNILKVHDWVQFHDRLSHRVASAQEFELMGYMPFAIVPWFSHLASVGNSDKPVEFPKADYECFLTSTANREVATTLSQSIPPSLRGLYTMELILTELTPMMMRIISPSLKPMNATLVKADEKATLARLVELMIDLNLRFCRDKNEDGQPMYRVEPAIDVFVHYDGKRAGDIQASRFAVRQLVSQAIEAELIKRRGALNAANKAAGGKELHSMFGAKKAGAVDLADKPTTDFFGRVVVKKAGPTASGNFSDEFAAARSTKKFRVMYKFNEGSSSAVRKPVKMSSLM